MLLPNSSPLYAILRVNCCPAACKQHKRTPGHASHRHTHTSLQPHSEPLSQSHPASALKARLPTQQQQNLISSVRNNQKVDRRGLRLILVTSCNKVVTMSWMTAAAPQASSSAHTHLRGFDPIRWRLLQHNTQPNAAAKLTAARTHMHTHRSTRRLCPQRYCLCLRYSICTSTHMVTLYTAALNTNRHLNTHLTTHVHTLHYTHAHTCRTPMHPLPDIQWSTPCRSCESTNSAAGTYT